MLTKDKKRLLVLENFFVDKTLPKFSSTNEIREDAFTQVLETQPSLGFDNDGWEDNYGGIIRHRPEDESYWDGISFSTKNEIQRQYINQYYDYLIGKRKLKGNFIKQAIWQIVKKLILKKSVVKSQGTVEEFFINIKQNTQELSKVDVKLQSYKKYLEKIKTTGQQALQEEIKKSIYQASKEALLFSINYTKYLTEENIISFTLLTERGIRLDWIKNFARHIPESVILKKKRCDDLGIFDNYVILHYDPNKKSVALTEKEKERKKDPILFGLIKGVRNLYFVDDWIDEICDLTFLEIAEKIGNKQITEKYK